MSRKFSPTLLGAFVTGAVILALGALALFGSGWLRKDVRVNVVYFSGSVKGLTIGAPVMFRGVTIGQVKDIRVIFDTRELTFRIPVLIETDMERIQAVGADQPGTGPGQGATDAFIDLLVKRGLRAQLQMLSLVTGQLFVQLDIFPESEAHFVGKGGDYQEIPTVLSSFEEVSKTLEQIPLDQLVQKVVTTLDGLENLVNSPELGESVRTLNETLQAVQKLSGQVDANFARMVGDVSTTMASVATLAEHLDAELVPVSRELRGTLAVARGAFGQAESALAGLDSTLAPQAPERAALRQALQELTDAARAVRILAEALELQPEMLLKGRQGTP
ncbi:MlaD family protein [Desulfuromonas carbonis]|uniref:MlaD family protein n=1 Tax=Desulfuromonas sp. DDH964 TaxID=1823759 RepID=UPI00078DD302|nr:MlaD family protein [Desulfuromonas sp. DDH964]AMV70892.1 Paraquat-inducible protein B [Desulfuromonas sp. DDH964]